MALIDFGKKESSQPASSQSRPVSVETVIGMKNQGYSNDQIVQNLISQGYDQGQVYDALGQADVKMTMDYRPQSQSAYPDISFDPSMQAGMSKEKIEEIAEAIIDEKWNEFAKNLDVIVKWKEKTESRLIEIEENIKHLKEDFNKVHASVLARVGEYDTNITNVGTTLKAMEQAFTKVLPGFVENVSELSRITKAMRDMAPQKKGKE